MNTPELKMTQEISQKKKKKYEVNRETYPLRATSNISPIKLFSK